jgi:acyl-CoA synthetase (NDP forming)
MSDPNAAIGAVVHDRAPLGALCEEYFDYMRAGHRASGKPVFLVSNRQGSGTDPAAVRVTREGFPVLDGLRPFLAGVRCLTDWRDFNTRKAQIQSEKLPSPGAELVSYWQSRLARGKTLEEFEAGKLLGDFNFPINSAKIAGSQAESLQAAEELGYPVVLKTAEAGILHKTDRGGVKLNIRDPARLIAAYTDLSTRLGPRVMVSPMLNVTGVEMVLGLVRDKQFGPLVMLGFGGINVETIRDVVCALPPFSRETALRLVNSLKLRPLLDGLRNRPAVNLAAFCLAAEQFSIMAAALGEVLDEVDVNPVIVHPDGCMAVDALVVGRAAKSAP